MKNTPTPLSLLGFEGAFNLPLWVGSELRLFEKYGLEITLEYVKGSVDLIKRMNAGSAHIALTSVDNVIAYTSAQGETEDRSAPGLMAFMGGDHGFLSLVSQADITSVPDLKGRTLSVDAMTTGFAFVLRDILARSDIDAATVTFEAAGGTGNRYRALIAGQHDATLVRSPFERMAERQGFKTLVRGNALYPQYLGTIGAVLQSWADANRASLIDFMLAYREALNWIFDTRNAAACCDILRAQFPDLTDADARLVLDDLVDPIHGLIHDMGIADAGLAQVLAIRNAHAVVPVNHVERCVDLQYLDAARASHRWAR